MNIVKCTKILPFVKAIREKYYSEPKSFEITAIRCNENAMDNRFDDFIIFSNKDMAIISAATTIPGKFWTLHPMQGLAGTAHMNPGIYHNSHVLGIHGASYPDYKHEAWIQCGMIKYRQDINRDGIIEDIEPQLERNWIGLNIHSCTGDMTQIVERNSAGCQVSQFMSVHKAGVAMHKESMSEKTPITYLLTLEKEWCEMFKIKSIQELMS
jgi:hypothetical protein